ncbi:MAG TPA: sulfurtransferase [Gammaproteobacteria bacterium]|jgi:thiosulfate/3-mercaptopyruvate sulfurtransferase|nr:sulfurtransferase [Arenicellales bacterium]MDP6791785.1 sulfurtransferase [Arenicellales bacterium]MDP6918562.1 sulfurtransferase [Arenicellales bacterium]HCX86857.1 sulfurtransferase [Gammaproteobacteria bacterium]|tara:strand:+ start:12741 stop:13598 length:858 start_codon:yes stop_codon:yes gene_type:complete
MRAKLISASELQRQCREGSVAIFDCRFALNDPDAGGAAFEGSHIPGARYLDLEQDLSGAISSETGRHPLPAFAEWLQTIAKLGVDNSSPIALYDSGPGVFAARLWWMLNWAGIEDLMLLDGGFSQWRKEGLAIESGEVGGDHPATPAKISSHDTEKALHINAQFLMEHLQDPQVLILDAREEERFSGRKEPLDKKAGCIPGSVNRHFALNLSAGLFKSPKALRTEFEEVLQGLPPESVVHSCGSGVTACHNLFAMEYAGLSGSRLYPGSWSEWIADPTRPIDVRG